MGLGVFFFTALSQVAGGTQRVVFNVDVVASACHVVVDADSTSNSGRLTFGTY
ncbi:fimbrial protein, partial [Escherichia coli]|nr:fimbrial protein [Escherichia coli]EKO4435308.1 fimbrial protein [Escherichia coli]